MKKAFPKEVGSLKEADFMKARGVLPMPKSSRNGDPLTSAPLSGADLHSFRGTGPQANRHFSRGLGNEEEGGGQRSEVALLIPRPADFGAVSRGTPRWCFEQLQGRLVEVTGGACLSLSLDVVHEAQKRGEPVAWITTCAGTFFPPDVHRKGIDLDALPVIRLDRSQEAARAAEHLLRSGSFGMVVLELGKRSWISMPMQSRLVVLAQKHQAVVMCLTSKPARFDSLSSLVSLRVDTWKKPSPPGTPAPGTSDPGMARDRSACSRSLLSNDVANGGDVAGHLAGLTVLKDKQRGLGWTHEDFRHGPPGLC